MKNITLILSLLFLFSCSDSLDIDNPNSPATDQFVGTSDDLSNLIQGTALTSYVNFHQFGFRMTVSVMSDCNTSSWGNAGMRDMSNEPRNLWNNSKTYGASFVTSTIYNGAYGVIHQLNTALELLDGEAGAALGDDKVKLQAFARFMLAYNYGFLANVFDKAVIIKPGEELTLDDYSFSEYSEILTYALENIDMAISLGNSTESMDFSDWFNGVTMDKAYFIQLVNSYGARILAGSSRKITENTAVDWRRVKDYATNGLQSDFIVLNDNDQWVAQGQVFENRSGWTRVDLRVINMMDPSYPSRFPSDGSITSLPESTSATDARLAVDFSYIPSVPFRANRGYYHFSNYQFTRLGDFNSTQEGPAPDFRAAENAMLLAEANARTGGLAEAISIVNAGTRITRGELAELANSATSEEVLSAIFHERTIELFGTGANIHWYDMRRRDLLQKGSLLHFPVPGTELEVLILDEYSFGGESNADGINTSNGGWF